MLEPWRVRLLGWLRLTRGGQTLSRFPTRQAASLLAALAYHTGRPQPREALMEMLWPGSDPDAARNRFRVTLSSLRKVLEPPGIPAGSVLNANRDTVRLEPPMVRTDVEEFESLLARAGRATGAERRDVLEQAVALYEGELLPGFYEDWIGPERDRLANARTNALCCLAVTREEAGDVAGAIEAARLALEADPLRESSHQHLMSLHLAAGEPAAALRQYRNLRRVLRRELGQPPSPATRALAESIRARLREPVAGSALPEEGAPSRIPPQVGSTDRHRTAIAPRLPVPLTRFIGRSEEIEAIRSLVEAADTRLVTLTGPGGAGKTRLALEVADRLKDAFKGAVWFVPLSERTEACQILESIAEALRLRRTADTGLADSIVSALGHAPALLLLDNFEHLAEEGALVVRNLLESLPELTVLATSQVRLQIAGEREVTVSPLPVPNGAGSLEALSAVPSVGLFVDRAQSARPGFNLNERNAADVADICRRLEGLPLAIELAAAWSHTLTPAQMLDRLSSRFDLLVSRGRDVFCRHRALRTTLEWSYRLLTPELQRTFARLAVFRNGWTMAIAQEVCSEDPMLEHLAALRERSLISAEDDGSEMRFSMLEALRDFAFERLDPRDRSEMERKHAEAYLRFAEEAEQGLRSRDVAGWLARIEGQHDNLRAALEHCLGPGGDAGVAARLAAALSGFWEHHGHFQEGRRFLARALAAPLDARSRLAALNGAGRLAVCQGDANEGSMYGAEALAVATEMGDRRGEALALKNLGFVSFIQGRMGEAVGLDEAALERFREMGDDWGVAATLDDMGSIVTYTGDHEKARGLLSEALAAYRRMEHTEGIASALYGLGILARDQGRYDEARSMLQQTLEAGLQMSDPLYVGLSHNALGSVAAATGDRDEARQHLVEATETFRSLRDYRAVYRALHLRAMRVERDVDRQLAAGLMREALALARENGEPLQILFSLVASGVLASDRGEWRLAGLLLAKGEEMRRSLDYQWPASQESLLRSALKSVTDALGEEWSSVEAEAAAMGVDDAVRLALGE
jgi:predicted ATPase/DNA-binding SARP family transcriptional activator